LFALVTLSLLYVLLADPCFLSISAVVDEAGGQD
jgi:hypothetical protein